ncbi:MAG: hypothetical protein WBO48_19485, partial [Candidatus Promineifilaceae bacterium]
MTPDRRHLLLLLLVLLLAACAQSAATPEPIVFKPTATLLPTPTLAAGSPINNAPTPMVTPLAGGSAGSEGGTAVTAPTSAPTISGTATPTPPPAERLQLGAAALQTGDFAAAVTQFSGGLADANGLTPAQQREARYNLAVAQLQDGRFA